MQWQWNFKALQHIFPLFLSSQMFFYDNCSEQYRNSRFSSVVEESQAKTMKKDITKECDAVAHQIREVLQMERMQGTCVIIRFNFFGHLI